MGIWRPAINPRGEGLSHMQTDQHKYGLTLTRPRVSHSQRTCRPPQYSRHSDSKQLSGGPPISRRLSDTKRLSTIKLNVFSSTKGKLTCVTFGFVQCTLGYRTESDEMSAVWMSASLSDKIQKSGN